MTSMTVDGLLTMLDYTYWARDRILDTASQLSPEEFTRDAGLDHRSVRQALVHTAATETYIRGRATGTQPEATIDPDADYTVESLREAWGREETALRNLLASLTDEELDNSFDYEYAGKTYKSEPVWQLIYQLTVHGTQHRSEVAMVLTQLGHSPGNIDFLTYTWKLAGN